MTSCHFHTVQRNNADKMARDFNLENCMTKVGPIETKSIVSLDQRVAFESMIADLSARFANVPTDLVESEIKQAQVTLREFLGFDRSSFAEFMEDGQVSLGKYRPEFDWYHRQLLAGEAVVWRASDTLPVEAAAELNYVRRVKL
jgi:hypothetical protein